MNYTHRPLAEISARRHFFFVKTSRPNAIEVKILKNTVRKSWSPFQNHIELEPGTCSPHAAPGRDIRVTSCPVCKHFLYRKRYEKYMKLLKNTIRMSIRKLGRLLSSRWYEPHTAPVCEDISMTSFLAKSLLIFARWAFIYYYIIILLYYYTSHEKKTLNNESRCCRSTK